MDRPDGFVFEYDAPEEDEPVRLPFRIMEQTFEASPIPAWVYFAYVGAVGAMSQLGGAGYNDRQVMKAAAKLDAISNVFRHVLGEDDFERFEEVMSRRGAPGIDTMIELVESLTEQSADRPTQPSTLSRRGRSITGRTSTASSSEKAATSPEEASAT